MACTSLTELTLLEQGPSQETWLELRLDVVPGGVSLSLVHMASGPEELWTQFGPGAVGIGWELGLAGLEKYVLSNGAFDAQEGKGWEASEEGIELIHGSSRAWAQASIEFGTAPEVAEAAAAVVVGRRLRHLQIRYEKRSLSYCGTATKLRERFQPRLVAGSV